MARIRWPEAASTLSLTRLTDDSPASLEWELHSGARRSYSVSKPMFALFHDCYCRLWRYQKYWHGCPYRI